MTERRRQDRIFTGVAGLVVLLVAAQYLPEVVGTVLITFSLVVFVLAVVGLVRPSLIRIPNRLASVWVFTLAAGLAMGGAVLLSPPNGEMVASDDDVTDTVAPVGRRTLDGNDLESRRWRATLARRRAAIERTAPAAEAEPAMVKTGQNSAVVTRDTWISSEWPFTVDAGVIGCVPIAAGPVLVFTDTDGVVWPLNGIAIAHAPRVGGRSSIDPIWREDPIWSEAFPGQRVSIGPMIAAARTLC